MVAELIESIKPIAPNAVESRNKSMNVKVYTVITCRTCLLTKAYLANIEVSFTDVDCDQNIEEALAVMKKAGSEELPIVSYTIGNEEYFILGYDTDSYDKLKKLCKS